MKDYLIEFRPLPRGEWESWALRRGTLAEAEASAEGLRRSIGDRAAVRVDGHLLRRPAPRTPTTPPVHILYTDNDTPLFQRLMDQGLPS